MNKLLLQCGYSLGDIVLLTAAVRDLHRNHPGRFQTDVRTPFPGLWENNPYLVSLKDNDPSIIRIQCEIPLIHQSNSTPCHALHGFVHFLDQRLGLKTTLTEFKGDIHLSDEEKSWFSQVHEVVGADVPFWIVVSGGKTDATTKWWDARRYQEVVNHFRGRILFVQVGEANHHHPKLESVIDLRGQTDTRQLLRLVYHAQGVLCPITAVMHLAAAVEVKPGMPKNRPCVVVAGGREPVNWEAYPHHQFIHTIGSLFCCDNGGCWKARVKPLGDGDERDKPENLCVQPVGELPRCMDMITAAEVIRRMEIYFQGGAIACLTAEQAEQARPILESGGGDSERNEWLVRQSFRAESERFVANLPPCPGRFAGRGVVICAGGAMYFTNAWVAIHRLRRTGCPLPIQVWHLGPEEMDARMRGLLESIGVQCVDALKIRERYPARRLAGYELKSYALLHCPFQEVLLLDADNVPLTNPERLFRTPAFRQHGAIFWPGTGRLKASNPVWNLCGVPYQSEPEFESGQMVVDKARCWKALNLALWYNEHSDFLYQYIAGDKDTFHLAFRKLEQPYSMPSCLPEVEDGVWWQHDLSGKRLFHHRIGAKWSLFGINPPVRGFRHKTECLDYLAQLRESWKGRVARHAPVEALSRPRWWNPVAFTSLPQPLRVLQICPSYGEACGVGNFARNLALTLRQWNIQVENSKGHRASEADLILVQHEHGLFGDAALRDLLARYSQPKILFAHSAGVGKFEGIVDGFAALCPGVVEGRKPVCLFPHPAYVPERRMSPGAAKARLGLEKFEAVLGTCEFYSPARRFDEFARALLPEARRRNWHIQVLASRHRWHDQNSGMKRIEQRVRELCADYPRHLSCTGDFLSHRELNLRLQACDLTWCWTAAGAGPYGSGTCVDQYGSGATVLIADKPQHSALFGLPNVWIADPDWSNFTAALIELAAERKFSRHDPAPVSWKHAAAPLAKFLAAMARR